jgi:hypothetical protein
MTRAAQSDGFRVVERDDPDPGEWELGELEYVERSSLVFEAFLDT